MLHCLKAGQHDGLIGCAGHGNIPSKCDFVVVIPEDSGRVRCLGHFDFWGVKGSVEHLYHAVLDSFADTGLRSSYQA